MSNAIHAASELEAVEIHGMTRSSFILKGALATGAVYGAGTVGPFVRQALAQSGGGDVDVLNFALTLEYLEAAFYKEAAKIDDLSEDAAKAVETFGDEEQQHVDALTKTIMDLGGRPVKAPMVDFGDLSNQKSFLKLATTLEDTGVSAYNGAAPSIKSKEVLAAAGSIVQVEARHAAAVRLLAKKDPAPDAFDKTLSMDQVLKAVQPYVKS
jgi:rubrerythrin